LYISPNISLVVKRRRMWFGACDTYGRW